MGGPPNVVTLTPLRCGTYLTSPEWFYRDPEAPARRAFGLGVPAEKLIPTPIGAFLAERPGAGRFLIDAGLHTDATHKLRSNFGLVQAMFFRTLRTEPQLATAAQLAARGIDRRSIQLIVMTHLHADHASALPEFPAARCLVDRVEWEAARRRGAVLNGYVAQHLPPPERLRLVDFANGAGQPHDRFSRTIDLLGDGSVRLISTPGHTPGHLSVLVRTTHGERLLAGDAVYTLRNLREGILPHKTTTDEAYRASLDELAGFARTHPDVPIIPTHDDTVWTNLLASDG